MITNKHLTQLFFRTMKLSVLFISIFIITFSSCKKNDKSPSVPTVSTTAATEITSTTAKTGGAISNNGGETIISSGVCWSKTNANPTINDDTTKVAIASGSFISVITNLTPSAKYYVRAYATNRLGTGYGNVITLNTGNGAPVATNVSIEGIPKGDELLTGNYTYTDTENDTESGTTFQWYVAEDVAGTGEVAIDGATERTYRLQDAQNGKYIRFSVKPKAAAGTQDGTEVKSVFIGAIGDATTVTFMYNDAEVTYNILISAETGKKWLDRNLGAAQAATTIDDYLAYGDLFQWGRLADEHQLITRTGKIVSETSGNTGITSTTPPYQTSSENVPTTNKFIIDFGTNGDWRSPQENGLWQGVDGINNPCPEGWRIPTKEEWDAEGLSSGQEAFEKLKITYTGLRWFYSGAFDYLSDGFYWTSTIETQYSPQLFTYMVSFGSTSYLADISNRGNGHSCRCIKN